MLTFWFTVATILLLELIVESLPLLVKVLSVVFILLHSKLFLLVGIHSESFFKGKWVDFL